MSTPAKKRSASAPARLRYLWVLPVVVALVIQLIYVMETRHDPAYRFPLIDAATYHHQAAAAAHGHPLATGAFWQPPFYPFALSVLYRIVGANHTTVRFLHAILAAAAAGLTYRLARLLLDRKPAALSAGLLGLYGPFVFFTTQLLPAALATVWNIAAAIACGALLQRRRWGWSLATGILIGLGALTVPNILVTLPLVVILIATTYHQHSTPGGMRAVLCLLLGCAAVIAPVSVRNRIVSGDWTLISTNGGINLFIGNNPNMRATIATRPGIAWDQIVSTPLRQGSARTPTESEDIFVRKVLHYARQQPFAFIKGLAVKTRWLLSSIEIPRNLDMYTFRPDSILLSALVWRIGPFGFPFGLVGPLALIGLVLLARRGPCGKLVAGWTVLYLLSVVIFFPSSRYVLPVIPFLLIATVTAGRRIGLDIIGPGPRQLRRAGVAISLIALAGLPISPPTDSVNFATERTLHIGVAHQIRGLQQQALERYHDVVSTDPDNAAAWFYRGTLLREMGRPKAAIQSHRQALQHNPRHYRAMNDLAVLLFNKEQPAAAIQLLQQSIALDPLNRQTMRNLAIALAATGRIEAANAWRARLGQPPLPE